MQIRLLDLYDPAFGDSGIAFRFPNPWRITSYEVGRHIERAGEEGRRKAEQMAAAMEIDDFGK